MGTKLTKLLVLILGIAALNILVLSPGFLGVAIGEDALSTAIGVTLLAASALILLYGSNVLLFRQPARVPVKEIKTHEDYVEALTRFRRIKPLEEDISLALEQLERMEKKKETLLQVLHQRFEPGELSFAKFASVIQEVEKLFYLNIRSVLNRLNVFDESEFRSLSRPKASRLPPELLRERSNLYNEYLSFVKGALGTNEEILLKLDKLLLEISRLDSIEPGDIEKMPGMQEIDALINQTKFYKQ
ncbi:hypothetical protein [Cohnella nanjingensis]|uniref:5-bromo-4-chloroindolyl phosphate hydrolysis protein n=1 Tax=Cohnella nanjingensis TaxID=1387779 RepID=A0A7X0RL64_9BACL|nr:hypothetical protein [Cohnella nanjingensis]MBB6669522.1 hypothetical protein [Cohnella nanjingensis]